MNIYDNAPGKGNGDQAINSEAVSTKIIFKN
jgi:hypothetical protein